MRHSSEFWFSSQEKIVNDDEQFEQMLVIEPRNNTLRAAAAHEQAENKARLAESVSVEVAEKATVALVVIEKVTAVTGDSYGHQKPS